jgi:membrane protein DedA with SNARE-associated domain/rhodanese-related sulfurtransferase
VQERDRLETLAAILKYGYPSLFLLLLMEALGLPIPGSIVLLAAGAAAATKVLHPGMCLLVALSAMFTGDTLLFLIGRYTGWALLGFLCRVSLNPETCILRAAESFYKRGRSALLFAKFVPGFNTMAPPLAGSMNMRPALFLMFDLTGASLYTLAFFLPGYLFSELLKSFVRGVQTFGTVLEWIILTAFVLYVAYRSYLAWTTRKFTTAPKVHVSVLWALANAPNPPDMVIADVRSHGYYDQGAQRIRGSVRLEPNFLTSMIPTLNKDQKIYLYCTCLNEGTSSKVAHLLREHGFEAYVIVGGLKAWQRAGLPVEPVPVEDLVQLPMFR